MYERECVCMRESVCVRERECMSEWMDCMLLKCLAQAHESLVHSLKKEFQDFIKSLKKKTLKIATTNLILLGTIFKYLRCLSHTDILQISFLKMTFQGCNFVAPANISSRVIYF